MSRVLLKSFQPMGRIQQLQDEGILVGDWSRVLPGTEQAYARMVAVMAEREIDCRGRPPIWAWRGTVRLWDVSMLLDPENELSRGYATITFAAPAELVLITDYQAWCEALFRNDDAWDPVTPVPGPHPAQATLPYLDADWVRSIAALPIDGWDELDLDHLI